MTAATTYVLDVLRLRQRLRSGMQGMAGDYNLTVTIN